MATFTAVIQIGQSSSYLLILDAERRGPSLNLVWGEGGGRTPQGRANQLLKQNGYQRITGWSVDRETRETQAIVTADGEVTQCSCWTKIRGGQREITAVDYWCHDHPEKRESTS